jgi:hypothetical protein
VGWASDFNACSLDDSWHVSNELRPGIVPFGSGRVEDLVVVSVLLSVGGKCWTSFRFDD